MPAAVGVPMLGFLKVSGHLMTFHRVFTYSQKVVVFFNYLHSKI